MKEEKKRGKPGCRWSIILRRRVANKIIMTRYKRNCEKIYNLLDDKIWKTPKQIRSEMSGKKMHLAQIYRTLWYLFVRERRVIPYVDREKQILVFRKLNPNDPEEINYLNTKIAELGNDTAKY